MTFLPYIVILLIVLTVHEYGHLAAAQIFGIRTSRMQIGIGPSIVTLYSGRTRYLIESGVPPIPLNAVIHFVARYNGEASPMTIIAWQSTTPLWRRLTTPLRQRTPVRRGPRPPWHPAPESTIICSGRVRSSSPTEAALSTMAWAIAPIPLAAYVSLPEAPHHDIPHCYNTTNWRIKTIIVATGVAANIALFVAVTMTQPFIQNPLQQTMTTQSAQTPHTALLQQTPYHLRVADTTIRYYRGFRAATENLVSNRPTPSHYPAEFSDPPPVCGPICAGQITDAAIKIAGLYGWITILGVVTIFTAALNLLPLPPLDGWKMALNTIQALRRKPLNPTTTMSIEIAAVAFIVIIALLLLAIDIRHIT